MPKKFAKDLIIGEAFENEPFRLFSIESETEKEVKVQFSDRSGVVSGAFPKIILGDFIPREHTGEVLNISASVLVDKRNPLVVVKGFAVTSNYLPAELYSGIGEEKKKEFINLINAVKPKLSNKGYLALVNACLTNDNLEKLGTLPATHGYYGCYAGGALAATVSVTYMLMSSMAAYVHKGNGITTQPPNWNVLLTAALLHAFGRIDYCDSSDPFKKSARGVTMNYFSTLQHSIETNIFANKIELSDQEIANLLNVLAVAVSTRTDTKAVSKDGAILRSIIRLYGDCDAIDYQIANHAAEEGEEYYYDRKLSRYLLTSNERNRE